MFQKSIFLSLLDQYSDVISSKEDNGDLVINLKDSVKKQNFERFWVDFIDIVSLIGLSNTKMAVELRQKNRKGVNIGDYCLKEKMVLVENDFFIDTYTSVFMEVNNKIPFFTKTNSFDSSNSMIIDHDLNNHLEVEINQFWVLETISYVEKFGCILNSLDNEFISDIQYKKDVYLYIGLLIPIYRIKRLRFYSVYEE